DEGEVVRAVVTDDAVPVDLLDLPAPAGDDVRPFGEHEPPELQGELLGRADAVARQGERHVLLGVGGYAGGVVSVGVDAVQVAADRRGDGVVHDVMDGTIAVHAHQVDIGLAVCSGVNLGGRTVQL